MNIEKLQTYEAKITAAKSLGLRKSGITGNFDSNHIKQIHKYLFEDVYPFAGQFRTENIAKKGEFRFAQFEYIETELERLLNKLKKEEYLQGLNKKRLSNKISILFSRTKRITSIQRGQWKNKQRIYKTN